jgi:hypothetical protein
MCFSATGLPFGFELEYKALRDEIEVLFDSKEWEKQNQQRREKQWDAKKQTNIGNLRYVIAAHGGVFLFQTSKIIYVFYEMTKRIDPIQ